MGTSHDHAETVTFLIRAILEFKGVPTVAGLHVLDFGCGNGSLSMISYSAG